MWLLVLSYLLKYIFDNLFCSGVYSDASKEATRFLFYKHQQISAEARWCLPLSQLFPNFCATLPFKYMFKNAIVYQCYLSVQ